MTQGLKSEIFNHILVTLLSISLIFSCYDYSRFYGEKSTKSDDYCLFSNETLQILKAIYFAVHNE